jgi:hypothetical protein
MERNESQDRKTAEWARKMAALFDSKPDPKTIDVQIWLICGGLAPHWSSEI